MLWMLVRVYKGDSCSFRKLLILLVLFYVNDLFSSKTSEFTKNLEGDSYGSF